jgi:hypothetical protein
MFLLLVFMIITSILTGFAIAQTTKILPAQPSGILTGTGVSKDGYTNLPGHNAADVQYGACVIRNSSTNMPGYNAADSGKGYAMKKMGKVKDYNDIMSKCLDAVYMQITPAFCQNSSTPGQWDVALYDEKGNDKTKGCAQSGCNDHACPGMQYIACVIKDSYTNMPGYNAADSGKGYAMKKMGTVKNPTPKEIWDKCLDAVYQQITSTFCQNSSNPGQWNLVIYDYKRNFLGKACVPYGCDYHGCPGVQYGACVIRNSSTNMPGYNAADSGKGYAMKKIGKVKDYNDIKTKCLDAIYRQITPAFCQNSSTPGQWTAALYDDKGNYKTTGCAQSGCNDHACPVNK